QHGLAGANCGTLANAVGPRAGAVEDPARVDTLVFSGDAVSQEYSPSTALRDIYSQHFTMIADDRSRLGRFQRPLGDEAFGKLTLRIFVIENGPLMPGVQRAFHPFQFHFAEGAGFFPCKSLVEPQSRAH